MGFDDMGDWVLMKLGSFGIDTQLMQRCAGFTTSSSIVTTRPDGARPALHKRGATGLGSQAGVRDFATTLDFITKTPRRGAS